MLGYFLLIFWHLAINVPIYSPQYQKNAFWSIVIANVMICRTKKESVLGRRLFSNRLIILGIVVELILAWLIIYNPTTHRIFGTYELTLYEIMLSLPFAFLILFADEIRKAILRKRSLLSK